MPLLPLKSVDGSMQYMDCEVLQSASWSSRDRIDQLLLTAALYTTTGLPPTRANHFVDTFLSSDQSYLGHSLESLFKF